MILLKYVLIILGMEGPHMSVSMIPTVLSGFSAKAWASMLVKVDSVHRNQWTILFFFVSPARLGDILPTPPFPLNINTRCFTPARRWDINGMSGSGPLGAEAQIF